MLDHVFTAAIGALRDALEAALLERMAPEERFQVDVLLGERAEGRTLETFALQALDVRVVSLRRASGKSVPAQADTVLASGDTLVLSGKVEALALAEQKLLRAQ